MNHSPFSRRLPALLLTAVFLISALLLSSCGKAKEEAPEEPEAPSGPQIIEIKITGENFYDYFDYREYPSFSTDEDGNITACNLSYGFSLRDGLKAANDPDHKDTLSVSFTAEGLSQYGEFNVDFQSLDSNQTPRYETVAVWSEERETVSETLSFWPQGGRTVSYPYGTISSSYVITFRTLTVTAVSGSIFLVRN